MSALDDYLRTQPAPAPDPATLRESARQELQNLVDRAFDAVRIVEDLVGEAQAELRDTLKEYFREQRAEIEKRIDQQVAVAEELGGRAVTHGQSLRQIADQVAEVAARIPEVPADLARTAQVDAAKRDVEQVISKVRTSVDKLGGQVVDVDGRVTELRREIDAELETIRKSVSKVGKAGAVGGFGGMSALAVYDDDGLVARRQAIEFPGVDVADDPANSRVVVDLNGTFVSQGLLGTTLGNASLDESDNLVLDITTHWGIHLGTPYYEDDADDITPGEEAIMHVDETGAVTWVLLSDVAAKDTAAEVEETRAIAAEATKVSLTGDQTIAGVKTFSSSPVVPDGSWSIADTTGLQAALDGKQSLAGKIPPGMFIGPKNGQRGTTLLTASLLGGWIEVRLATQPIDQLSWEVTVAGDSAAVITAAIYSVIGTACTRVVKTAAVSATSTGVKTDSQSATLPPGLYLAVIEQTGHSATRPTIRTTFTPDTDGPFMDSTDLFSNPRGGVHQDALVNATGLPASFTLVTGTARSYGPVIGLRCA